MTDKYQRRLDWVKSISQEELEKRLKEAKTLAEMANKKISFYKDELERRKQEVPLGVPLEDKILYQFFASYRFYFESKESEQVFSERLKDYVEALQKLAKGEPIDIKVLLPLLKKGYVAMDEDGRWFWYECKPLKEISFWDSREGMFEEVFFPLNLKSAENWKTSLMECGL